MPDYAETLFRVGEHTMKLATKTLADVLQGYLGAWTIGLFFGLGVLLLRLFGKLKIKGQERLLIAARDGHLVIMANHPSLVEAYFLPVILSPRHLFDLNLFFWSLPDRKLFLSKHVLVAKFRLMLFGLGRCIMITRSLNNNYLSLRQLNKILSSGDNVVIHPEGGRTMKGTCFVHLKGRRVRKIETNAATLAARLNVNILPVFVEKEEELAGVTNSFISLLTSRQSPMIIYIGDPYKPDRGKNPWELNRELEQKILKAGLP